MSAYHLEIFDMGHPRCFPSQTGSLCLGSIFSSRFRNVVPTFAYGLIDECHSQCGLRLGCRSQYPGPDFYSRLGRLDTYIQLNQNFNIQMPSRPTRLRGQLTIGATGCPGGRSVGSLSNHLMSDYDAYCDTFRTAFRVSHLENV
jgi:hypothetical protein